MLALVLAACTVTTEGSARRATSAPGTTVASRASAPATPTGSTGPTRPTAVRPAQSPPPAHPDSAPRTSAGTTGAPSTTSRTTASATSTSTTTTSSTLSYWQQITADDQVVDTMLGQLATAVQSGQTNNFLSHFDPSLRHRMTNWFANTRKIGVAEAHFARFLNFQTGDGDISIGRNVVVGIRTPYDDPKTAPGVLYKITVSRTPAKGKPGEWRITTFDPRFVEDPVNCDCVLDVDHSDTVAVVHRDDEDVADWSQIVLDEAESGSKWLAGELGSSGLSPLNGHVLFLATKPYHWYLRTTGPAESDHTTISMDDAVSSPPGTVYSSMTRVVISLFDEDGPIPDREVVRLFLSDVITHEETHQLMAASRHEQDKRRTYEAPWIAEGIAVASESQYHRYHQDGDDLSYHLSDDPTRLDGDWLAAHVDGPMGTPDQLYRSKDGNKWYALAGSVFLWIADTQSPSVMFTVARELYADSTKDPFSLVPDPDHPGKLMSAKAARAAWTQWVENQ